MKKVINVLVFPCGNENAIEILNALSGDLSIRVFGGSSEDNHGQLVFKNYIGDIPFANHPAFFDTLNSIVEKHNIHVLFPTHDAVVDILAKNREKIKCHVVAPEKEVADIIREKRKTYEFFKGEHFCPKIYLVGDEYDFPIFIKPSIGEVARGTFLAKTAAELCDFIENNPGQDSIICENLSGLEYSVECFTDKFGTLIHAEPRIMQKFVRGIYLRSASIPREPRFTEMASVMNQKLKFRGLWYYQCKEDGDGNIKLLEVAQKVSGTMSLLRLKGINLPLLTVYDLFSDTISYPNYDYKVSLDRLFYSRYRSNLPYTGVIVNIFTTLIQDSHINTLLLAYLYQQKALGKRLVGICSDKAKLNGFNIHHGLFDEYLSSPQLIGAAETGSIYLDDDFQIRQKIATSKSCVTFASDVTEMLMDWRQ